jgi:hypothetical protein
MEQVLREARPAMFFVPRRSADCGDRAGVTARRRSCGMLSSVGSQTANRGGRTGHQRDTQGVLSESAYASILRENGIRFMALNRDELIQLDLRANCSGLKRLWLPETVVEADFLESMAHGENPSLVWLHSLHEEHVWHRPGEQIWMAEKHSPLERHPAEHSRRLRHGSGAFVIADGIMAMQGNGALNGTPQLLGRFVLADDPVAADATCARLMGLEPDRVPYIREASTFLGDCCVGGD